MSAAAYAGPVRTLREPGNPGKVKLTEVSAALASLNRLGRPKVPFLVILVWSGATIVPGVVRKKLVGKLKPLDGLIGKPECHRAVPAYSHPPIIASTRRLALAPNRCPRPKGRSMM